MRWWPPLLHLLVLAAILPIAWQRLAVLQNGPEIVLPQDSAPSAAAEQDLTALLAAGEPVELTRLMARPLFLPGREGEVAVPDSPVIAVAPPPEAPRMVGYVNDGTKPRAILASQTGTEEAIVREGDEFIGFTVLQVQPDAVVLRREGEEITVNMFPQ